MKSGISTVADNTAKLLGALRALPKHDVLVGVPEDRTDRKAEEDDGGISNAAIGYMAENGCPEKNIPQRQWLVPSIRGAKVRLTGYMKQAARAALEGKQDTCNRALNACGLAGQAAARAKVNEGIAPALADATIAARARRGRKGAKAELENRKAGNEAGTDMAKPLVDTGQFRNSISYVVRGGS